MAGMTVAANDAGATVAADRTRYLPPVYFSVTYVAMIITPSRMNWTLP